MAVSVSFHKNVSLLTQLVSPNEAFRRHFREGMFDKPNTTGFIHVSHYLLTIYDSERFRKLVEWPIVCKKSESKYRSDVKDFIGIVATEHPEAGLPSILGTYLLHAGGTKFINVMWKLSQVVLYVYIKRESDSNVLLAPQSGITDEVTKKLLINTTSDIHKNIEEMNSRFSKTERRARSFVEDQVNDINDFQNETFEKRQAISELAANAIVAPAVKKRLTDIQDIEIMKMWKETQAKQISDLQEMTGILKTVEDLSTEVAELTTSILNDNSILDVSRLPKIDANNDLHSMLPPESQVLFSRMYTEEKLVLQNLFRIVLVMLSQLRLQLQIHKLQDLSQCQLQVEASTEDAKSMCSLFLVLLDQIANLLAEVQNTFRTRNMKYVPDSHRFGALDSVLFMPSPTICIDTNADSEKVDVLNRLALTPVEGAHKALFSRHQRKEAVTPQSSKSTANFLVSRINLDNTLSSIVSERSTPQNRRFKSVTRINSMMTKKSDKYSRLFSGHHKMNVGKANSSILSIPSSPKANSTALMNTISATNSLSEISLDFTAKSIFNLSKDIISAVSVMTNPNNLSPFKQNKPQVVELVQEEKLGGIAEKKVENNMGSPVSSNRVIKPMLKDNEVEVTSNCTSTSESSKQRKRRSISDLVERYKQVLENSRVTSHLETSEQSNESK
ncbi:uncharacterized protein LOC124306861 isoform X1 [Neodiprion virginianus]|uniref:uncharacterized protein LOC124306861 isoform X1 n=1 Tax=Neodiprion virginianus TaxID=2961670 RepID=UPI001EE70CAE|nr:uncharacterized protein LOC124306861 isoform X1 [Neodiprion virginianus]